MQAVKLARSGVSVLKIAERCKLTIEEATAVAAPIGKKRIKELEALVIDLMALTDEAIQQQAVAFRAIAAMQAQWDRLSVRVVAMADRAEQLVGGSEFSKRGKRVKRAV
jgi:hypothetical protein